MKTLKNFLLKTTLTVAAFAVADQISLISCWSFPHAPNRRGSSRALTNCTDSSNCTALHSHASCLNGTCICTANVLIKFSNGCPPEGADQTGSSDVLNILVPFFAFFVAAVAVLLFALLRMRVRGSSSRNNEERVTSSTEGTSRRGNQVTVAVEGGRHNFSCEETAKEDLPPAYTEFDLQPPPYEVVVLGSQNCSNTEVIKV